MEEMIYGNKKQAPPIKKIDLRIWKLRDEVETIISDNLKEDNKPSEEEIIEKCRSRYANSTKDDNVISLEQRKEMEGKLRDNPDQLGKSILGKEDYHPEIPKEKITLGGLILSEINVDEMFFFCNRQFLTGQSIVIEFIIPNVFTVNSEVLFSRPYSTKGRVISERKLPYRTHVQFTFFDDKEKMLLENFIKSIESEESPKIEIIEKKSDEQGGG